MEIRVKQREGELGSKVIEDLEGVKKRREGRDRGWEKWEERERGGEGPVQSFCPRAQLVDWPPLGTIITTEYR
jgi:hypothetical protein